MSSESNNLIEILLVEDNPGDIRLTQEALKEGKILNNLSVVTDGVEAMAFLRREGRFENAPRPELILLDLNLPKKDGREVLAEIKEDPNLRLIPVVVLGLLQLLLTWANTKSRTLENITQGTSTLLVKDGQPQMQGLTRERVTLEDLAIALREKEVENLADVKEAYLEPTGQISVLKQRDAQPVTPKDAQLLTLQRLDQVLQQNLERTRQKIHRLLLKAEEEQATKAGGEGGG